jgi:hypothetical protein
MVGREGMIGVPGFAGGNGTILGSAPGPARAGFSPGDSGTFGTMG